MKPVSSFVGLVLMALLAGCSGRAEQQNRVDLSNLLTPEQQYKRSMVEIQERRNDEMIEQRLQELLREAAQLEAQGKPLPTHIKNAKELAELRRIGKAKQLETDKAYKEQLIDDYSKEYIKVIKELNEQSAIRSGHST